MGYGLKLTEGSNNFILTPEASTIISAGRVTLPSGLNGDDTYGTDIDLPDTISVADLGVIVTPVSYANSVIYSRYIDGSTLYYNTFYADSTKTYYTRNDSTGVMTSWSAGNRTANSKSTWNPVLSVYPIAFWDKMGATTFSKIRLFGSTAYLIRDTNDDTNFSLTGTASGNCIGTITDIKDNNEMTMAGAQAFVDTIEGQGQQRDYLAVMQVAFPTAKTIYKAEVCLGINCEFTSGTANGYCSIELYYGGAWHQVIYQSWSGNTFYDFITFNASGRWNAVTAIRAQCYAFAQKGSGYTWSLSQNFCRELRAYGATNTDDEENKIVYTIGSGGVLEVDYVVIMKKYNY